MSDWDCDKYLHVNNTSRRLSADSLDLELVATSSLSRKLNADQHMLLSAMYKIIKKRAAKYVNIMPAIMGILACVIISAQTYRPGNVLRFIRKRIYIPRDYLNEAHALRKAFDSRNLVHEIEAAILDSVDTEPQYNETLVNALHTNRFENICTFDIDDEQNSCSIEYLREALDSSFDKYFMDEDEYV